MYNFLIGVIIESFKLERSKEDRIALKNEVNDSGLVFSALCGDLGMGFGNKEKNAALIEKSKR